LTALVGLPKTNGNTQRHEPSVRACVERPVGRNLLRSLFIFAPTEEPTDSRVIGRVVIGVLVVLGVLAARMARWRHPQRAAGPRNSFRHPGSASSPVLARSSTPRVDARASARWLTGPVKRHARRQMRMPRSAKDQACQASTSAHLSVCRRAAFIASSADGYQRPPVLAPHEQRQRQAGLGTPAVEISSMVPATDATVGRAPFEVRAGFGINARDQRHVSTPLHSL